MRIYGQNIKVDRRKKHYLSIGLVCFYLAGITLHLWLLDIQTAQAGSLINWTHVKEVCWWAIPAALVCLWLLRKY